MPVLSARPAGSRRGQNGSNPKDAKMASVSKQNALAGRMTIDGGHFTPIPLPFWRLEGIFSRYCPSGTISNHFCKTSVFVECSRNAVTAGMTRPVRAMYQPLSTRCLFSVPCPHNGGNRPFFQRGKCDQSPVAGLHWPPIQRSALRLLLAPQLDQRSSFSGCPSSEHLALMAA